MNQPNIRILFVDDEANVLSGLRRMLRSQRNIWDMQFASGGEDALTLLQQQQFDVIVTDMRMPGIDGAELLSRVAKLYPNSVRLVLSGQSEHEKIFRAIGPAHQFLAKPCDPEVLIGTIERACGLQSQLHDDALKKVTSQITCLPSLPSMYRDLVEELESDDASVDRVGDMIGGDLAMSAKVLQLVNSSFFGLPQHVSCPKHAVSLLGLDVIRPLALTAGAFSQYSDPGIEGYSLEASIHHSLAVAMTARWISVSETNERHVADDTFLAGMMHDIGKLILAVNLTEDYQSAVQLALAKAIPLWEAEQLVFGTTHAEVGAHLLGLWGLPNPIVEAVAFHHQPIANGRMVTSGQSVFSPLTAVHVADVLQHESSEIDHGIKPSLIDMEYLKSIDLAERLPHWMQSAPRELIA